MYVCYVVGMVCSADVVHVFNRLGGAVRIGGFVFGVRLG